MPPAPDNFFDPNNLTRGRFTYFPVVPGRTEFTARFREAIVATQPEVVALELPGCYESAFRQALHRLPELSVLLCAPRDEEYEAVYYPVEVTDPFVEAARTALEVGARLLFLEPDSLE